MAGMIRKRGKQSWEVRIELGANPVTGKRRQRSFSVRGTRKDAEKAMTEALHKRDTGIDLEPTRLTLGQYLDRWLCDYAVPNVAPSTLRRYRQLVSRISRSLGGVRLQDLRPAHIQALYGELLASGSSSRTVEQHHRVLKEALRHAAQWQLLARNPADAVTAPRPERRPMRALTDAEVGQVLTACGDPALRALVALAVATGARLGELLGIRWEDVDLGAERASISRSLQYLPGHGYSFRTPKTARSRRSVALSPATVRVLREHRLRQAELRLKAGPAYQDHGLVFASAVGTPLDPNNTSKRFKRAAQASGIGPCRFHDLRHTAATLMLKAGIHPKIVSERLGHSSVAITLDTYSHVLPDMQQEAAAVLDDLIGRSLSG